MPITLDWKAVLLRLFLTMLAGGVLGINRGEHARPAGLRTTILVCLAASAAMIQANLLLGMAQEKQSLVTLDLMRLPLGILSGIGFIGGGAILKRGDLVHGVTTAATLWFCTVMGLCFGGGQLLLGGELLAIAVVVLWGLKSIEERFIEDRRATLTITLRGEGLEIGQLREMLTQAAFVVSRCALTQAPRSQRRVVVMDLRWHPGTDRASVPPVVRELARLGPVTRVKWEPR